MNQVLDQSGIMLRKKRAKYPKHVCIVRAYKFAMDVSESKASRLFSACDGLLALRNRLCFLKADERRANREMKDAGRAQEIAWAKTADLFKLVSAWSKDESAPFAGLHAHLLQNVVDRVEEGTKRWLEAVTDGRTGVKPPAAKERKHYRSFTYKQYGNGCRIQNHRVHLSGFGWFKIHDHRKILGRPTSITVKFAQGRWWCVVTARSFEADWYRPMEDFASLPDLGGDPGLSALITTSDGQVFDPPRSLKDALSKLRRAQRAMSRKFEARKACHALAKAAGGDVGPLKAVALFQAVATKPPPGG